MVGIWESKTRLCLRSVRGWGMRGRQGPTVPHSEMVAVQKDTASNLAWRRDGLFLLVGFFFFWKILSLGEAKQERTVEQPMQRLVYENMVRLQNCN